MRPVTSMWLVPFIRLEVPERLENLLAEDPTRSFSFDELAVKARIGRIRLNWLLNQMARDRLIIAEIVPGRYPNQVRYRLTQTYSQIRA